MGPQILSRRLAALDEALQNLDILSRHPKDEFLSDFTKYGSAERFLQIAIEVLTDLGNHIIANRGLGPIETMNDIPRALYSAGLIESSDCEEWIQMVGFRNILVHDYVRRYPLQRKLSQVVMLRAGICFPSGGFSSGKRIYPFYSL